MWSDKILCDCSGPGCPTSDINLRNIAWVKGNKEAPVSDDATVILRCSGGPTNTPTSTHTSTRTSTPTNTATNTVTNTITNTRTNTPTSTFTYSATFSHTPTLSFTNTITNSPTNSRTNTPTDSPTNTATFSFTFTPSSTATLTFTRTFTATNSFTFTETVTGTQPPTWTFTNTFTNSPTFTPTLSFTGTHTPSFTATNSLTFTSTTTGTPPPTWTFTSTFTNTNTFTPTFSPTHSPTCTFSFTPSFTFTPTATRTFTLSFTPSFTFTSTSTFTFTRTHTPSFTFTYTFTITQTPTITPTPRPSPVDLIITLSASGEEPKPGAKINYTINIKNPSNSPVYNISVWDTLPGEVIFKENKFTVSPNLNGTVLRWDLGPQTLDPGKIITIEFTVEIGNIIPERLPIVNKVSVDYNDQHYTPANGKHPPITSDLSFYPIGEVVVYPNPFNPETARDKKLKFENIIPGSVIQIFTISGEMVNTLYAKEIIVYWDAKNRYGKEISPGIYMFIITNKETGAVKKGRIFVVKK